MITRLSQLQWAKRALERLGTPQDIAYSGWMHKPPTAETIDRAYAAARHAFDLGLPIESLHASARESKKAERVSMGYCWGDLPAAVNLDLGRFWTRKHTAVWVVFEASGDAVVTAFGANYPEDHAWQKPFTETCWPEIDAWLKDGVR